MSKPLHIVIAAPGKGTGKGGIVRQMQYLAEEATKHDDVRISWLCTHSNNRFWPLHFIRTLLSFFWLAITDRPDGIHLNLASKGSFYRKWILFRLARCFSIPHIAHLHGGGFEEFYQQGCPARQKRIADLFTTASSVIVLGEKWKNFVQTLGVDDSNIQLIANAVPTPAQPSHGHNEVPQIIFVGHLLPRKGVGELIDALAELKDLNWQATLAGSGKIERYQQQVKQADLQERVSFPGWLGDTALNELYQQSDILVLPSHIENQPLCILEAMAHGLAIITTDVGTVNEMINENTAIVIKSSQNSNELKNALQDLITHKEKRQKLRVSARDRHLQLYCLNRYYGEILSIYLKFKD